MVTGKEERAQGKEGGRGSEAHRGMDTEFAMQPCCEDDSGACDLHRCSGTT